MINSKTITNDFLPEGYTIPSTSRYMKFQEGMNKFRVLGNPILGMEYWKTLDDGKRTPIRKRMDEKIIIADLEINPKSGQLEMPQHFWAMPVWNYQDKAIQILEIKQKGILKAIKSYTDNPKWGNPAGYDILVTKEGSGMETKYFVDHDPKEDMEDNILKEYEDMGINMEALFKGEDPFDNSVKPEEIPDDLGKEKVEALPF